MPAQTDRRTKRRGGFYWEEVDGKEEPFVSVTTVLKVIDKPALMHWMAREVYYAMATDPSLSLQEARAVTTRMSKEAMRRGSLVHGIAEEWKKNQRSVNVDNLPKDIRGYAQALDKWGKDVQPFMVENEKTVVSKKYGYAGTLDALAKINDELVIIDYKSNKKGAVYDEAHIQIAAYQQALKEMGIEVNRGFVIGISEDGKYNMVEARLDLDVFLAAKLIWEFKEEDKINKMGYTRLLRKTKGG